MKDTLRNTLQEIGDSIHEEDQKMYLDLSAADDGHAVLRKNKRKHCLCDHVRYSGILPLDTVRAVTSAI